MQTFSPHLSLGGPKYLYGGMLAQTQMVILIKPYILEAYGASGVRRLDHRPHTPNPTVPELSSKTFSILQTLPLTLQVPTMQGTSACNRYLGGLGTVGSVQSLTNPRDTNPRDRNLVKGLIETL